MDENKYDTSKKLRSEIIEKIHESFISGEFSLKHLFIKDGLVHYLYEIVVGETRIIIDTRKDNCIVGIHVDGHDVTERLTAKDIMAISTYLQTILKKNKCIKLKFLDGDGYYGRE